jgi:hypothetical protein
LIFCGQLLANTLAVTDSNNNDNNTFFIINSYKLS